MLALSPPEDQARVEGDRLLQQHELAGVKPRGCFNKTRKSAVVFTGIKDGVTADALKVRRRIFGRGDRGMRSPGQSALRARPPADVAQIELVALEPLPFSSTQVRARVQAGESLAGFVPPKVADYIMENRLYQSSKGLF
ncbi:MAG: hypothetical protein ACLSDO_00110 [Anaerotruncus colihominis]